MQKPEYELSQNNESVFVQINVPFANISQSQCLVEDNKFYFYCDPYYLNIKFNIKFIFNKIDSQILQHDSLALTLFKKQKDQFYNQDLLKINYNNFKTKDFDNNLLDIAKDFDNMQFYQYKYGFGGIYEDALKSIQNFPSFFLLNPEKTQNKQRLLISQQKEFEKYQNDNNFVDDDDILELYSKPLHILDKSNKLFDIEEHIKNQNIVTQNMLFSKDLLTILQDAKQQFLTNNLSKQKLNFYQIYDILFSYLLDWRISEFEQHEEQIGNIIYYSASVNCFVHYQNIQQLFESIVRRSFSFSYIRNENLTKKVFIDLKIIIYSGIEIIKSIFLRIQEQIQKNDEYFLFGKLFIVPIINFLTHINQEDFRETLIELNKISIKEIEKLNPKKNVWIKTSQINQHNQF